MWTLHTLNFGFPLTRLCSGRCPLGDKALEEIFVAFVFAAGAVSVADSVNGDAHCNKLPVLRRDAQDVLSLSLPCRAIESLALCQMANAKKVWIGVAALLVLLLVAVVSVLFQPPSVRIVSHDPAFVIYDVRYYPQTNQIHYWHWRTTWREALRFVGLMHGNTERGPALVLYHSAWIGPSGPWLPEPTWVVPDGEPNGGWLCNLSCEYFGSNKCVTKLFCPLTNGHYRLSLGETNWANIEVNLPK